MECHGGSVQLDLGRRNDFAPLVNFGIHEGRKLGLRHAACLGALFGKLRLDPWRLQNLQHIKSGQLRALGVTSLKRSSAAPDIPTLDESGVKGFEATAWFGLYGPAGMRPELMKKLSSDVLDILQTPRIKAQFAEQGAEAGGMTQPEFAAFVNAEIDKWGKVIASAQVKLD